MKRLLVGLLLLVTLTLGSAPAVLAHDGDHSVGDFLVKTGGLIVATYNAIKNPATILRAGAAMVSGGGALIWGQQYGIHAAMYYGRIEYTRTTQGNPLMTVTAGP